MTLSGNKKFPAGFLWGAATSSHQVEGDNRWNDWWEYEQSGRLPFSSGAACHHYELYRRDFDLIQSWNHNAHRFSIEWSRIEPAQGQWNSEALAHYRSVIEALRARGIEPVVTLHHFTNPAWFSRRGGWLRGDSARLFARYAAHTVEQVGEGVRYWLTLNEPTVCVMQGYINGEWPPLMKSSRTKATVVLRNLARAHVAAYDAVKQRASNAMVGFAHNAPLFWPCDPESKRDRLAAHLRDLLLNRAFFRLIGMSSKKRGAGRKKLDFVGINYYTRTVVRASGYDLGAILGRTCRLHHHTGQGPMSSMGWEVFPRGLGMILKKFAEYGLPLLVTENGVATDDEALRHDFLVRHLEVLENTITKGVNVIGYLYWSLMDNYEWTMGTRPQFGLAAVDFETQERSSRPCAEYFARVCRESRLQLDPPIE